MPEYQASLDTGNPQSDSLMGVLSQLDPYQFREAGGAAGSREYGGGG